MNRVKSKKNNYKVVSLFSGIGGFDLGFQYSGFDIAWANDFDKYACETYRANISNKITLGDIRIEKENIPPHDILIGGFPCQPFSTLGSLKGFKDEERGTLFFEIKKIIEKHKTKIVVLENVKNLLNHNNKNTFKKIIQELEDLGYKCFWKVLNSMDFGVPQRRNRVFIVAFLKEEFLDDIFNFPIPTKLKETTQNILDKEVDEKYFLSQTIIKTILGTGTKNYIVKPTIDTEISKTLTATMHKMHRASQDNYITDEINFSKIKTPNNKVNIRKLTPNECRKLQGFPDDWAQVVSNCQAYKQFGNAVTVNVSFALAKNIHKYILKNKIKPL